MESFSESSERLDPTEPYLKLWLTHQRTTSVEHAFQIQPNPDNKQDYSLMLYAIDNWLENHGHTISVDKKPFIELKKNIFQTWFDTSSLWQTWRIRSFGTINPTQSYSIRYDIFLDYQAWDKAVDGQARRRFPFPGIKNTEFLQDIKVNAEWEVLWITGINYVIKKDEHTFQLGTWVNTDKKLVLTSRIKTMHGSWGTKHIINYTLQDKSLSLRDEVTKQLINNCALLISIKSKIDPEKIEINPVVGIEYTF